MLRIQGMFMPDPNFFIPVRIRNKEFKYFFPKFFYKPFGYLIRYVYLGSVERLDQGHLYPLGECWDKHVTGGARTSAPLHRRRRLYLKSYLDSYTLTIRNLYMAAPVHVASHMDLPGGD